MAREASGSLPGTPTTLLTLGDVRTGSPEAPIARNHPEPNGNHRIHFFYAQVNYHDIRDEIREADHMDWILKLLPEILKSVGKNSVQLYICLWGPRSASYHKKDFKNENFRRFAIAAVYHFSFSDALGEKLWLAKVANWMAGYK